MARGTVSIDVLSNRAEAVSGGDALVAVKFPKGTRASRVRVSLNGRDVTAAFAVRPTAATRASSRACATGPTSWSRRRRAATARASRSSTTRSAARSPSGPQIKPWTCFDGARDASATGRSSWSSSTCRPAAARCSPTTRPTRRPTSRRRPPTRARRCRSSSARRPARSTATSTASRCSRPGKPWQPWAPQDGYNRKLVVFHGASCDTHYEQADAPDVLNVTALARGFATMSHALNNAGHNCNIATQAESMIMTKECLIERYGPIRYTIGSGCSGGALAQHQVANAYPGFYQGITPACSFTDAWSSAMHYVDYQLLRRYFENPRRWAPGVAWAPDRDRRGRGPPEPAQRGHLHHGDPLQRRSQPRAAPACPRRRSTTRTQPEGRALLAPGLHGQHLRPPRRDRLRRAAVRQRRHRVRPQALEGGRDHRCPVRRPEREARRWDIDYNQTAARVEADRPALERVYRSGAINQATSSTRWRSSTCAGPTPAPSTTSTAPTPCGRG